ncbi:MAG: hypothetical protein LBR33_04785 [Propionibacteriaceae bacterium]|nr:hypothetical protein [Propionibacteriaceae bacterium]
MIKDSAHRHLVADEDITHAREHWLVAHTLTDVQRHPFTMYVGPDRAGNLIEVGENWEGDIIHAQPARPQYLPRTKRQQGRRQPWTR